MANPIWITGQGQRLVNLGSVTEGTYFEYPLDSYDPNGGLVTYKFLAGALPPGIRISPSGSIQGAPYLNTVVNETTNYDFTVRATDQNGLVSDKSFAMTIANINPPVITTPSNLGQVFDGQYYSLQLKASELNPYADLTWTISAGGLPPGLTLSSSGLISGFIIPLSNQGNAGQQGFNADPFNEFAFANTPLYQDNKFLFTVSVFDGANYANQSYILQVTAKDLFTADGTYNTLDNSYLTIDHDNVYVPIMTTPSLALPEVRSNSKFAFQFQAIDPNDQQISFSLGLNSSGAAGFDQGGTLGFDTTGFDQEDLNIPPGLSLDPSTGWFTGTVGAQPQAIETYNFQVYAFETNDVSIQSVPITYTMNILGDITNSITWTTSANLGVMDNGTISELSVSAVNNSGRALTYSLGPDSSLPQGLELNSAGLIVGRTGFEYFSLDKSTTTIDGLVSGFDNVYNFTVQASTVDQTASSQKTFTVTINNFNVTPYEDIYIKALPTLDQRETFLNIVNNNDIFPSSLLYRASDPNFGRARDIRSLFLAGLKPSDISTYLAAMNTNTYNKRVDFGEIKTAVAVDANFNTKYEVVYIQLENDYTYDITTSSSVTDKTINRTVNNNSYENMSSVVSSALGYANIGALPDWMTSPQANKKVLGFTRAIVLAYTVPGASNLIAYRLGASGISFNEINFVVDRYDLDNTYSANYNIATQTYDLGKETTFDRIKRSGTISSSADYSLIGVAFNQINNQPISYINSIGGLDGKTDYQSGDTVVFLQQENFPASVGSNEGWIYTNKSNHLVPGWNEFVNSTKYPSGTPGLPSNPYVGQVAEADGVFYMFVQDLDSNGNVLDTVWKIANLRANPWTINIDSNDVVTLTPATFLRKIAITANILTISGYVSTVTTTRIPSMIQASDTMQVNRGVQRSETVFLYNPALTIGESVPTYTKLPTILNTSNDDTRFDGYGTRFINNRISYENPEVGDSWLKFPNHGPLL